MGNLAEFLNNITVPNSAAINLVGNLIGTLADLSGGVSAVVGLIDLFTSTAQNNEVLSKIEEVQTAIKENFTALRAEQRAEHILDRLRDLDPPIAQAQTVFDQLIVDVSKTPPLSEEFRLQQIGFCLDALNRLDQDDKWTTVFADEVYYAQRFDDFWAGEVAPTANADGLVFTDRYILPSYLRVLHIFMLVAAAFEPGYNITFREPLRRFTTRLEKVYDFSRLGIVAIRRPTQDQAMGNFSAITPGVFWFQNATGSDFAIQEYGVVHVYSGYSSRSSYPQFRQSIPGQLPPGPAQDEFYLELSAKLNLAIERNWKQAYIAVGLRDLRDTINALRKLTGDPPLPGPDPSTWSLSKISHLLGSAFVPPGTFFSTFAASDFMSRLAMAGGLSPQRPLSLRSALSAALAAATDLGPFLGTDGETFP